jgi:hypothetical protein
VIYARLHQRFSLEALLLAPFDQTPSQQTEPAARSHAPSELTSEPLVGNLSHLSTFSYGALTIESYIV